MTLLRTEFIKLRRLVLAKERLVVIVMVEVVVMLDGINLKFTSVSLTYFFSRKRFSMKDPVMLLFVLQRWSTLNLKISFTYFVIEQITVNNNGHPMNS